MHSRTGNILRARIVPVILQSSFEQKYHVQIHFGGSLRTLYLADINVYYVTQQPYNLIAKYCEGQTTGTSNIKHNESTI